MVATKLNCTESVCLSNKKVFRANSHFVCDYVLIEMIWDQ